MAESHSQRAFSDRSPAAVGRGPEALREADVRRSLVVVCHDAQHAALTVLLPVASLEEQERIRAELRRLGFVADASPAATSIAWRLALERGDLAGAARALASAVPRSVLDLGATFALDPHPALDLALPSWWPGRFMLSVGGTRRCVVFDAGVDRDALADAVANERDDFEEHEFHPPTE